MPEELLCYMCYNYQKPEEMIPAISPAGERVWLCPECWGLYQDNFRYDEEDRTELLEEESFPLDVLDEILGEEDPEML